MAAEFRFATASFEAWATVVLPIRDHPFWPCRDSTTRQKVLQVLFEFDDNFRILSCLDKSDLKDMLPDDMLDCQQVETLTRIIKDPFSWSAPCQALCNLGLIPNCFQFNTVKQVFDKKPEWSHIFYGKRLLYRMDHDPLLLHNFDEAEKQALLSYPCEYLRDWFPLPMEEAKKLKHFIKDMPQD